MKNLDSIVTMLGIIYGITLIFIAFIRTKYTEPLRIDALFMPNPSDATRPLNLVIGVLVAGYMLYSLF